MCSFLLTPGWWPDDAWPPGSTHSQIHSHTACRIWYPTWLACLSCRPWRLHVMMHTYQNTVQQYIEVYGWLQLFSQNFSYWAKQKNFIIIWSSSEAKTYNSVEHRKGVWHVGVHNSSYSHFIKMLQENRKFWNKVANTYVLKIQTLTWVIGSKSGRTLCSRSWPKVLWGTYVSLSFRWKKDRMVRNHSRFIIFDAKTVCSAGFVDQ